MHPTGSVTRAGAGTAKPSNRKQAEAEKMLEKRADSPASSARFVRCRLLDMPDTFAHFTAQLLRRMRMLCLLFCKGGAARASEPEEKDWACQAAFAVQKCGCKRSMD